MCIDNYVQKVYLYNCKTEILRENYNRKTVERV